MFVDDNLNERFDRNEMSARTNARGECHLGDLQVGVHRIIVTPLEEFAPTARAALEVLVGGRAGFAIARAHFGQERIT